MSSILPTYIYTISYRSAFAHSRHRHERRLHLRHVLLQLRVARERARELLRATRAESRGTAPCRPITRWRRRSFARAPAASTRATGWRRRRVRPPARAHVASGGATRARARQAEKACIEVPVRMWQGWARCRCRCGRGEPSPTCLRIAYGRRGASSARMAGRASGRADAADPSLALSDPHRPSRARRARGVTRG